MEGLLAPMEGFWRFAPPPPEAGDLMHGVHDPWLTTLSVVVACLAGTAALYFLDRVVAATDFRRRALWLLLGSVVMGCGIWSLHFTGMLAFELPVQVHYTVGPTALSLVPAILGSAAALYFMAQEHLRHLTLHLGAVLIAAGIGGMHYTGMEAMELDAVLRYEPTRFALSVVVAYGIAYLALVVRFRVGLRAEGWTRILGGVLLGNAVAALHYTAMAAARFHELPREELAGIGFSDTWMQSAVGALTIVVLALSIIGVRVHQRLALTEASAREHREWANALLQATSDGVVAVDPKGRIVNVNQAGQQLLAPGGRNLLGRNLTDVLPELPPVRLPTASVEEEEEDDFGTVARETAVETDRGRTELDVAIRPVRLVDQELHVLTLRDVTQRKLAEHRARTLAHRLQATLDSITDAFYTLDTHWRFTYVNDEAARILGRPKQALIGDSVWGAVEGFAQSTLERRFREATTAGRPVDFEYYSTVKEAWFEVHAYPSQGGLAVHFRDITERKQEQAKVEFLALYDPLTHLPNRELFQDRLRHAIALAHRENTLGAVIFFDLDHFKGLNDTFGHPAGDQLLQQMGQRLEAALREADTAARLGGDEFAAILGRLGSVREQASAEAITVAHRILDAVGQPFEIDGRQHHTTASMGIALFGDQQEHDTVGELMKQADYAMYQAKDEHRGTLRLFDKVMADVLGARADLENALRGALEGGRITAWLQPQFDERGRIVAAEALARWEHPTRGTLTPDQFIPLAEHTGLITPLGDAILEFICARLQEWARDPVLRNVSISMNVSPNQFQNDRFVEHVRHVLDTSGADPAQLRLELTEESVVTHLDETVARMNRLREMGLTFSIDDFGTGYSSLGYLKQLPLSELKIDKSFVMDALADPNDAAIVRTIIVLARTMGLHVVAEGVETQEVCDFLAEAGCYLYQGFLFAPPMPPDQAEAFMRDSA